MPQRSTHKKRIGKNKETQLTLAPSIWIGKNGVNESVVRELQQQLKNNKFVKVKMLRSALEYQMSRRDIAEQLERLSGAPLIELRGYTAVYRSPYRIRKEGSSRRIGENDISHKD